MQNKYNKVVNTDFIKMGYTFLQYIWARNMLGNIGMEDDELVDAYLSGLERTYGKMEEYYPYKWRYSVSDCLKNIQEEIKLKVSKWSIADKVNYTDKITATDLASYIFCPISYSIKRSFEIESPSNVQSTQIGLLLHSRLGLIQQIKNIRQKAADGSVYNNPFFNFINTSDILFTGHDNSNSVFENAAENFRGSPDYIFRDNKNEVYAVEEKFIYKRDPNKTTDFEEDGGVDNEAEKYRINWQNYKPKFFNNHKVQLISYLRNINDFEIKYGILVYWYYDFNGIDAYIHKFSHLKISMTEDSEKLYQEAKNGINGLQQNREQGFNISDINSVKCAACVVNKYCGHKTKKFNVLSFPYDRKYMILKPMQRLKERLVTYLTTVFPESDLLVQFGEIVCDFSFTISTIPQVNIESIIVTEKTQIAIAVFHLIFKFENQEIWVLNNEWDQKADKSTLCQFSNLYKNSDSWCSTFNGQSYRRSFFIKNKSEIDYVELFKALVANEIKNRIYFIDPTNNIVFIFWDDSVYVGSKDVKKIKPIYEKYYSYINEYSRLEFEKQIS